MIDKPHIRIIHASPRARYKRRLLVYPSRESRGWIAYAEARGIGPRLWNRAKVAFRLVVEPYLHDQELRLSMTFEQYRQHKRDEWNAKNAT